MNALPPLSTPTELRERTLRRALAPDAQALPPWVTNALLLLFCVGHLGWCLRLVLQ